MKIKIDIHTTQKIKGTNIIIADQLLLTETVIERISSGQLTPKIIGMQDKILKENPSLDTSQLIATIRVT